MSEANGMVGTIQDGGGIVKGEALDYSLKSASTQERAKRNEPPLGGELS